MDPLTLDGDACSLWTDVFRCAGAAQPVDLIGRKD